MNSYYGHGKEIMKLAEKHQTIHYFKDYCGSNFNLTYSLTNFKKFPEQHDIILLITFNHEPILENILFLNELHQSFFKKIVFCGKNIRSIVKSNENNLKKFDSFSLIDFDTHQGYLHYHCMSKVIDLPQAMGVNTSATLMLNTTSSPRTFPIINTFRKDN
jgi:hypothetical protein